MRACVLALCGLAFSSARAADEPKKERPPVREISLKGLRVSPEKGDGHSRPRVLTTPAELMRSVPREAAERIGKEVDFKREKVFLFVWAGSGGDRLTFERLDKGAAGPVLVLRFRAGRTRDLREHARAFVVPRDASWRVVK
jgi:hypothetical protein